MKHSLGELVDKLTIVNMKIWACEDLKRSSKDDKVIADATRRTNSLNVQRNDLIDAINELANELASGTQQKTYSSNKMYGKS